MKKLMSIVLGLFSSAVAFAGDSGAAAKSFWSDPVEDPMFPLYVVSAFVLIVLVLVIAVIFYMLRILNLFVQQSEEKKAFALGVAYKPKPSPWNRFWERINATVPLEKEDTIELDHNFDGIKELDNHLPPWWKWLFYGTIGWALIYIIVFHVTSSLPLSRQEYDEEIASANETIAKLKASQPAVSIDESSLSYTKDATHIERGKNIFISNCASCHKENGAGGVGPNLTDDYWLHGGGIKNIYSTIKNGVPEKGMISWGPVLKPEEIRDAAFYVMSLKGTNPLGAKAPQGELAKPENPSLKTDTLKTQASL